MKKEIDFINKLSTLSLEEKNNLIISEGKPGKIIPGIIFDNISGKNLSSPQYNNK